MFKPSVAFVVIYILHTFFSAEALASANESLPQVSTQKIQLTETAETLAYPARVESRMQSVVLAESDGVVRKLPLLGAQTKRHSTVVIIQNQDPIYQYAPTPSRAPISGIVSEIFVSEGSQVSRGQKLLTLVDPQQTLITIEVPSKDIAKIHTGSKATFVSQQKEIAVEVIGVSPLINAMTGTATAQLRAVSSKEQLLIGLLGQIQFKTDLQKRIMVDENSIVYKQSLPHVRVLNENKVSYRAVELGQRQAGQIEILKGVTPDEVIVKRSSQYLGEGKKVQVQE